MLLGVLLLCFPVISRGLIEERIVHCEQEALKIGTRLSDIYNGPVEEEEWDIRVHQEMLMEHLGFAPWMANGVYKSGGKTPRGVLELIICIDLSCVVLILYLRDCYFNTTGERRLGRSSECI